MMDIITTEEEREQFFKALSVRNAKDEGPYRARVNAILADIKTRKDEALLEYTRSFDWSEATLSSLVMSRDEMATHYEAVSTEQKELLMLAAERIERYQKHLLPASWTEEFAPGETMGQKVTPLASVGLYVPGGKAAYPSSVLMSAIPARVAGVERIVMASPAPHGEMNELVIAAAYLAGVKTIYRIGGAQAIAALAYGTETVQAVDKIVGPGNIYVALAKQALFGTVGIDSIAGPSEILVIADETSDAEAVATDLLAQAEHDQLASAVLLTPSLSFAKKVQSCALAKLARAKRKEILASSLHDYARIIITRDLSEALTLANRIAPEHLELAVKDAWSLLPGVKNAGAIFLGDSTPEALGDYLAGPDHILPTATTARFSNPLSVVDFVKTSSVLSFSHEALSRLAPSIEEFASLEGLEMHGESVSERFRS